MTEEHPCMIREFDGCRCQSADECQSFNAEQERKIKAAKEKRAADRIASRLQAKRNCERAVLVALAFISIAAFLGATAYSLRSIDKQIEWARV